MRIAIVIFDGFDELDAIGPYEVLRNAAQGGTPVETLLVTREPAELVTGSHGLAVQPQAVLEDGFDLVLVPGGGWNDRAEAGAWAEAQRGALPALLGQLHAAGTRMASVCTGAMLLASAGITRGRPAATHHGAHAALAESGALLIDARVVDDGDLVTAAGVTSGIDLALWIVEREWGSALADAIACEMEHERRGEVHRAARA